MGGARSAATCCLSRCASDAFAMAGVCCDGGTSEAAGVCCGGRALTGLMMAGTGVGAEGTGEGLGFDGGADVAVDWTRR